jgi:hypothetical protein
LIERETQKASNNSGFQSSNGYNFDIEAHDLSINELDNFGKDDGDDDVSKFGLRAILNLILAGTTNKDQQARN